MTISECSEHACGNFVGGFAAKAFSYYGEGKRQSRSGTGCGDELVECHNGSTMLHFSAAKLAGVFKAGVACHVLAVDKTERGEPPPVRHKWRRCRGDAI